MMDRMFVGGCVVVVIVGVLGANLYQCHLEGIEDEMERGLIRVEHDQVAFAASVEKLLDQAESKGFFQRPLARKALAHIHAQEKLVQLADRESDIQTARRLYKLAVRISDDRD